WLIPLGSAAVWTSFIMAPLLVPMVLRSVVEFVKKPADLSWGLHVRDTLRSFGRTIVQALCALTFLPDEAFYSMDAIVRTFVRLTITKRKLLEWRTSSEAEKGARTHLLGSLRAMWFGPVLALLMGGYLLEYRASAAVIAAPILI